MSLSIASVELGLVFANGRRAEHSIMLLLCWCTPVSINPTQLKKKLIT